MEIENYKEKGFHFGNALYHALTECIDSYGEDTEVRHQFVSDNQHLFAGVMLVAMFSYLESTLGSSWIDRHGGSQKNELSCLKIIRNAYVHTNSNIKELESTSETDVQMVESFIQDLTEGKVKDDKGNTYPVYMSISPYGVVGLNREAINIFRALMKSISH